ncbi:hypothetical protein AAVH_42652, partial [Aphelenchoides avenae]
VQNGVDEDHFVDAEEGEEQDSVIVKKSVDAEREEAGEEEQFDDAPEEPPADEDRTEDQVIAFHMLACPGRAELEFPCPER